MISMEQFDEKLDLFLRKKMSKSEEDDFISELKSDSEKMARAKVVALAVKNMTTIKREIETSVVKTIFQKDKKDFLESIWASPKMELFDERVDKFLRKQMSAEEEKQFLLEINDTPYLKERAKAIALAVKEIKGQSIEDKEVIDAIKNQESKSTGKIFKLFNNLIPYFAAACVGAFCLWGWNNLTSEDSISKNSSVIRSADNDSKDPVELFAKITDPATDISWMIQQLDSCYIIAKRNNSYLGDLQWNLAIAHMLNGDKTKAIEYLKEIVNENEEGDALVNKANDFLKTLE